MKQRGSEHDEFSRFSSFRLLLSFTSCLVFLLLDTESS